MIPPSDWPRAFSGLAASAADLLRRIGEGRAALKAARPIIERFDTARVSADTAFRKLEEFLLLPIPPTERLRFERETECARLGSGYEERQKEANTAWLASKEATHFIHDFANDVELFTQRLPLSEEGQRFARAIGDIKIRKPDCWLEAGDDGFHPDLETLKLRLEEILDLASNGRPSPQAPARKRGHLSERDGRIEDVVTKILGSDGFQHHDNPEIIGAALRDLRRDPALSALTEDRLRVALNRIRTARGHPSSNFLRKHRRSN